MEYIRVRWENVVFQFSVNLLKVDMRGDEDERHLWIGFRWHPKAETTLRLSLPGLLQIIKQESLPSTEHMCYN